VSRILVVDDEPAIRTFLMEGLTDAGYTVLTASNGAEALQRAGECRSDAVLLDLLMPVMDGLTFLRMRQSQPDLARVPVVVLTAAGIDLDVLSTVLEHVLRQPPRPVGTCPICGGAASMDLDPGAPVSGRLDAIRAARLTHVLLHSAEDFARMPMRQQLLQLAADRRQLLTDWLYRDLRYDWGDQDRRGVHSVDEALSSAAVHRFWQDALCCSFEHCRHESDAF